jgi:hypothetical protein
MYTHGEVQKAPRVIACLLPLLENSLSQERVDTVTDLQSARVTTAQPKPSERGNN